MNSEVLDSKLKTLIQLCKETGNYARISAVFFSLLNNLINEIGPKLAIRNRNMKKGERIYEYMNYINQQYIKSLDVPIFQAEIIEIVRKSEILFLRNDGMIPRKNIKNIIEIYYNLRDLKVPNFNEMVKEEKIFNIPELDAFNYLIHEGKGISGGSSNNVMTLVMQKKIKDLEFDLQENLKKSFNSNQLEKLLYIKRIGDKLSNNNNNKISLQGPLKDDIVYNLSKKGIVKYFVLGLFASLLSIGVLILLEMDHFTNAINVLTPYLLFTIVFSILSFYAFHKLSKKKRI